MAGHRWRSRRTQLQCSIGRCPYPAQTSSWAPSALWHNNRSSIRSRMAQLYEKVDLRGEGELLKIQKLLQEALDGRAKVGAPGDSPSCRGLEVQRRARCTDSACSLCVQAAAGSELTEEDRLELAAVSVSRRPLPAAPPPTVASHAAPAASNSSCVHSP